jgi:hypothetical protein
VSPPLSMPNLALQIRYKGTTGAVARVLIDAEMTAVLTGTGALTTANVCLPESTKGMTKDLMLGIGPNLSRLQQNLSCTAHNQDFVFDDLKFVSDASCAASAYVADGGFERTDPGFGWEGVQGAAAGDTVGLDTTVANVHGGARALKLVNSDGCGVRQAAFPATVPPPASGAGPALTFFYKAPSLTAAKLAVDVKSTVAGAPGSSGDLAATADYTRAQICLDPTTAGQPVSVEINLSGTVSGVCAGQTPVTAWFDDFAVTTSADCPAN